MATPRGGGIGIVVSLLLALTLLAVHESAWLPMLLPLALGVVLVAGIGWIDDHRPLPVWQRLATHVVAAMLLAASCLLAGAGPLHALLAGGLAVGLTNAWNFMDGIDGLAASQALLAALAIALGAGSGPGVWFGLALAAGCAGFLPFNFPTARIFLGDVGSGTIGYALACLIAISAQSAGSAAWLLLPLSACLVDASLTLAARMVRGERWWTAHVSHLYQRLARAWHGHRGVTTAYVAWTLGALLVMMIVRSQQAPVIMGAAVAWYLAGAGTWWWASRQLNRQAGTNS